MHRRRLHNQQPTGYLRGLRVWCFAYPPRAPSPQVLRYLQQNPLRLLLPNRLFYDRRMIRQAVASDALKAVPLIVPAVGHKADRGTGILSHGTEFVMYQGALEPSFET